jgi:putative peptidoglycan lipid II flippase
MVLNLPIISVLFQRGAFSAEAAVRTGEALFFYGMGLWAFSVVRVFVQSFYALQDAKWPMRAAMIAFAVNLIFSLLLMQPMQHKGLALANSLSAMANVFILSYVLKKKIGKFLNRAFYLSVVKMIISSILMALAIRIADHLLPWNVGSDFQVKLLSLTGMILLGVGVFFLSSYLLKSPEIRAVINLAKNRLSRQA